MKSRHSIVAAAALALAATPALAQNQDQAAAPAQAGQPHAMMCTMAMLPHGNMGGGMGDMLQGGMARQGGMAHGQMQGQQGEKQPMQHGQAQGEKMQHGQMQHAQAQGEKQGQATDKPAPAAGMQHGAMQGGMKHPVTPTMLIHHAQDLALTPDQVSKVTALVTASTTDCQNHLKAAMEAHHSAFELLGAPSSSPDLAAYEAKLREATTHVLQAHIGVVKAGQEARALLTAEQLQKLGKHEGAQAGGGHTGH